MKTIIIFLVSLTATAFSSVQPTNSNDGKNISVYVFLHESCRISQFYTLALKDLHQQYAEQGIEFKGIFPNQETQQEELDLFKTKYDLSFEMFIDYDHLMTNKLGATVTPEVVVFDEGSGEIIYRGRIDDSYFRVGRRKQVKTTSELEDVLYAINNDEPVNVEFQDAIGCFIQKK